MFNYMYPEEAKKISKANQDTGYIIWNAFAKATWLHKFFEFTPDEIRNNPDKDKKNGTYDDPYSYPDEINID